MNIFCAPSAIPMFLADKGISRVIAFSGGAASAPKEFGPEVEKAISTASKLFEEAVIKEALLRLRPYREKIAILTGGTKYGVPVTASTFAKQEGFWTIGIVPAAGADKALPPDILDLRVKVDISTEFETTMPEDCAKFSSDWGDESPYFAKTLDGVIVFGGGAGTLIELGHILKLNERRLKNKFSPKYIVPIMASGGMAAAAIHLPGNPEVKKYCMPDRVIRSGQDAAAILEEKLFMFDIMDEERSPTDTSKFEIPIAI